MNFVCWVHWAVQSYWEQRTINRLLPCGVCMVGTEQRVKSRWTSYFRVFVRISCYSPSNISVPHLTCIPSSLLESWVYNATKWCTQYYSFAYVCCNYTNKNNELWIMNYILKWNLYDGVSVQNICSRTLMIEELEGIWKETVIAYRRICLEELRTTNAFSEDSWYPGRNLNLAPPDFLSEAVPTRSVR
jgi:hypothetical protein